MSLTIGLVEREDAVSPAIDRLRSAGVAGENIALISNTNTIGKLLGCDPPCIIRNYTAGGAVLGIGVYAIFGVAAALCECGLMQFGKQYGAIAFTGALLAGMLVGGVIGFLVGAGEAEKDSHLYVQGVRTGGMVISVRVPEEDTDRVKQLLSKEDVRGVKLLLVESA